ncbi:hypothetical protein [Pedobacter foliorum]|uniref:hypothetical protein n=1 Tax=Pedobacter foliorum TaxID=2739058 RepID=UPI0015635A99|nr:hypothetical protein [Pedobacter foliorum]NRF39198.1 hypothetical protein [Pedobacter foliorum]
MKESKKLIIDLDQLYREKSPGSDTLVLSNEYENEWTLDVRKFKLNLPSNVRDYGYAWQKLIEEVNEKYKDTLIANEAPFFDCVISPLSRWIEAIEYCFNNYNIENVFITSYSSNQKIFFYEAEGEANTSFLYKKSYFLPFYLKLYIEDRFRLTVNFGRRLNSTKVTFNFYFRNLLLFLFVVIKNVIFKCLTFKRNFLLRPKDASVLISSRAIVQTEFIKNYQVANPDNAVLIVNEQSFRLFKHYKYLKKLNFEFIYAEGLFSLRDLKVIIGTLFTKLWNVKKSNSIYFEYSGIKFHFSSFIIDVLLKELDYLFYSKSVDNAATKYLEVSNESKLISFEMFTPHSFYLKRALEMKVYQVQTTFIEPKPSPNFICSDFFYFTNPLTYQDFIDTHEHLKVRFGCIPFLKYIGHTRIKHLKQKIEKMVYFTQPIDLEEEANILSFMEEYCNGHNIRLIVKPHPRQLSGFNINSETTLIADKFVNVDDLIKSADLIITRSSSLGLDAWIYGIPCIFVKLNKNIRNQNLFYAPNDYAGNITSFEMFKDILDNYSKLKDSFCSHELYKKTDLSSLSAISMFNN